MRYFRAACALPRACLLVTAAGAAAQTLSLEEAIHLAEARSAKLRAQVAAINATGEVIERAAELPDPELRFGIDNLPVTNSDAFRINRDFMTMRRIGRLERYGRGELGAVLETRRAEVETRLAALTVALERARAWARLKYVVPHEENEQ
jgi:hypothetical protein